MYGLQWRPRVAEEQMLTKTKKKQRTLTYKVFEQGWGNTIVIVAVVINIILCSLFPH